MDLPSYLEQLQQRPAVAPGLERVRTVAERLQLLPVPYQVLTVGGTNGKGSTVALCSHILRLAHRSVGTYTSPHLLRYNERIAIDLTPVSDAAIVEAFSAIDHARGSTPLSYFEFSLLAALYLFRAAKVEVAVLEVGLGGRLDAVNIVEADVAIVSTVDFDHMEYLGHSLEAIAKEKAGIFRSGKPAVYGDLKVPEAIVSAAQQLGAPLYRLGSEYHYEVSDHTWSFYSQHQQFEHLPLPHIYLPNAANSIMGLSLLPQLHLTSGILTQALRDFSVPGRLQVLQGPCSLLLDVSHNPQSARLLAQRLAALQPRGQVHAVFAAMADKEIGAMLAPVLPWVDVWHIATLNSPRAATLEQLSAQLSGSHYQAYASMTEALDLLFAKVQENDWIVVFGSFYTVAAAMQYWEEWQRDKA